jgi:hypothetical protein
MHISSLRIFNLAITHSYCSDNHPFYFPFLNHTGLVAFAVHFATPIGCWGVPKFNDEVTD